MLEVSQKYREMADNDAREIMLKVVIGETVLTNDDIIELNIYRSTGENGFNIGGVVTTRIRLLALMKLPYEGEIAMDVFVRFGFDAENASDYVQFGHFYGHASNPSHKTAQIEIIGYDKLGSSGFNSRCTFAKVGGAELSFPCTVQEMLEYVCKRRNIECEYQCLDYTVSEMPVKDRSKDDSDYEKYYTYKEILGFIAAAHGASAAVDNSGKLVFIGIKESAETVESGDCIDFALTSAEKFTVKGILLHVQNVLSTGSTNIFINDDSKTAYDGEISEGVVETSCPFGSIEIAEALWGQLGGFSYNSCEFTRRGRGWTELGDIIKAVDNLDVKINGEYINRPIIAQTIEWSFTSDGGFMEHIISKAENSEESSERLGNGNAINNVSGGVGEFTNDAKNSEIFNSYKESTNVNNGAEYKALKNYINPKTSFAHVGGYTNAIDSGDIHSSIGSAILSGSQNEIAQAAVSVICGGAINKIQEGPQNIIGAGVQNKILGTCSCIVAGGFNTVMASFAGIVAGRNNTVSKEYSAVLTGWANNVLKEYSAILSGASNSVEGAYSVILCGSLNKNLGQSSAIINGNSNFIDANSNYCTAAGISNRIERSSNACVMGTTNILVQGFNGDFVTGYGNYAKAGLARFYGRFLCGQGGILKDNIVFAVGNGATNAGASEEGRRNIFFIDDDGNAYARSFNIIGSSEASAFSARSEDNPDLSELTARINQMQSDIEALKAEIEELKAR